MTHSVIWISFQVFLLAGLFSCRTLREPEYREIDNLRMSTSGLAQTVLTLDLVYFNPNNSKLKMKKAEGEVFLNNTFLGHFKTDSLIRIPKKSDFIIPVTLKVDMQNILKNSMTLLVNPAVTVKVQGKARLGKGFIFINTPIRYEGVHSITELMK
jgi:LEA14-like dessication related protein